MAQLRSVCTHFARAPFTSGWLALLLITTVVQHAAPQNTIARWLDESSTDLVHLGRDPFSVLTTSLMWLDGAYWLPYLAFFGLLLAPVEQWLGARRWLVVGLLGHVAGTYISQGLLWVAIFCGVESSSQTTMRDVGVSYFMFAILGVFAYRLAGRWRTIYIATVVVAFVIPLLVDPGVTNIGHLTAVLVGLACYPLTRAATLESVAVCVAQRHILLPVA